MKKIFLFVAVTAGSVAVLARADSQAVHQLDLGGDRTIVPGLQR